MPTVYEQYCLIDVYRENRAGQKDSTFWTAPARFGLPLL